jgi:hypothetical protein
MVDLTHVFKADRSRAIVRGIVITIPIIIVFALLLATADPIFAGWRDEIERIIDTLSFIPRTIFFIVLLVIVLGAYSFASRGSSTVATQLLARAENTDARKWLGPTERVIVISAVTGLFWLFIAVQLSYLFGNVPGVRGSVMTFADYARQGFGELAFVATLSALLILLSERYGTTNGHTRTLKALTIALLGGVLIILGSAFRRVLLYEDAYGYTVARLYAQVYMIVLAIALVALAAGVLTTLNTRSLFRRMFAVATAAFIVLVFWNHEAWIASANIERFRTTGKLDVSYLTRDLSLNAVPVIVARLSSLPEPQRIELHNALVERYSTRRRIADTQWFEWNYRRQQARSALATIGLPLPQTQPVVVTKR